MILICSQADAEERHDDESNTSYQPLRHHSVNSGSSLGRSEVKLTTRTTKTVDFGGVTEIGGGGGGSDDGYYTDQYNNSSSSTQASPLSSSNTTSPRHPTSFSSTTSAADSPHQKQLVAASTHQKQQYQSVTNYNSSAESSLRQHALRQPNQARVVPSAPSAAAQNIKPPSSRKRDLYTDDFPEIDHFVMKLVFGDNSGTIFNHHREFSTLTELVNALTAQCRSEMEKARAIYVWITVINLNEIPVTVRDPTSPMALMLGIKYGTESYHGMFQKLCRCAGLRCEVIPGLSKSVGYKPGMSLGDTAAGPARQQQFRNAWNAVFIDENWRLVQCNWGARHLVNDNKESGYHSVITAQSAQNDGTSDKNRLRYEYDDHYFMTDPEEFIHEFYPDNPEWQLLPRGGPIISLTKFTQLPFVRSLFFRYGLRFTDGDRTGRSTLYTDETGAVTVALNSITETGSGQGLMDSLIFHYNFRFYTGGENMYRRTDLKRFVMQSRVGRSVVFRVHAPCPDQFLLDIFANANAYDPGQPTKFKSVCKFQIISSADAGSLSSRQTSPAAFVMVPLPDCAEGEWGPKKAERQFRGCIRPLSHPSDAVVNCGPMLDLRFHVPEGSPIDGASDCFAELHENSVSDPRKLDDCIRKTLLVQNNNNNNKELVLQIKFPKNGQFGLDIYAPAMQSTIQRNNTTGKRQTEMRPGKSLAHCCKYLINIGGNYGY